MSNSTVEKPGKHYLYLVTNVLVMPCGYHVPPDVTGREGLITSVAFFPKPITPVQAWEKHQTNPIREKFYKIPAQYSSKNSYEKQGKIEQL